MEREGVVLLSCCVSYLEGRLGWRSLNPSFLKCPTSCSAVTLEKKKKEGK